MELDVGLLYKYYVALFLDRTFKNKKFFKENNITKEDCYKYANLFWLYNFKEELDLSKEESEKKLYKLLDDMFRYRMLTDIIDDAYVELFSDERNDFIYDHYDYLNEKINETYEYVKPYKKEVDLSNMPKLSHKKLDSYFRDYLMYIDPEGDYLKAYEYMIKNNRIIFLDMLPEEDQEKFLKGLNVEDMTYRNFLFHGLNNGSYLIIDRKGDISDFKNLAHEFTHYLTRHYNSNFFNGNRECDLICEFPNIYYEILANQFLMSKGYKSEDVAACSAYRCNLIYNTSENFGVVNDYFEMYKDLGEITRKEDISRRRIEIDNYANKVGYDRFKELLKDDKTINDPALMADLFSESCGIILFSIPDVMKQGYSYIIGYYLACKYLARTVKNQEVLKEMKDITMNLPNINLYDLFRTVDQDFDDYQKKMS